MIVDLVGVAVLGVLTFPRRRRAVPGALLVVAGACIEVIAGSMTTIAAGGLLVAAGVALLTGRDQAALYVAFGSVFLMLAGFSVAGVLLRTDSLSLLRFELPAGPKAAAQGAMAAVWIALMLRLSFLPVALRKGDASGMVAAMGPGWWSAAVLAAKLGAVLPQNLAETVAGVVGPFTVGIVAIAGIRAFWAGSWPETFGATSAGIGAVVAFGSWFGAAEGVLGARMVVFSTAVAGCALSLGGTPAGFAGTLAHGLRLLVLGFPLGAGFLGRLRILAGVGGVESTLGITILACWVVPLAGWMRHATWSSPPAGTSRWATWAALAVGFWGALEGGAFSTGLFR
jgi:hypothetical protein